MTDTDRNRNAVLTDAEALARSAGMDDVALDEHPAELDELANYLESELDNLRRNLPPAGRE